MANSKTDVQDEPDDVSKPLPFKDRARLEKSIKAATLLEQIAQFTYTETSGLFNTRDLVLNKQHLNPYLLLTFYLEHSGYAFLKRIASANHSRTIGFGSPSSRSFVRRWAPFSIRAIR